MLAKRRWKLHVRVVDAIEKLYEPQEARRWAEKEIAICEEYLLPLLRSHGMFQRGWALAQLGEIREGVECMREGLAGNSRTGAEMGSPYLLYNNGSRPGGDRD